MNKPDMIKLFSKTFDDGALSVIEIIKTSGAKGTKWEDVMLEMLALEQSIKDDYYNE
jgi:hypothetical protein